MPISSAKRIFEQMAFDEGRRRADRRRFLPVNHAIAAKTPGFIAQTAYRAEFSGV